MTTVRITYNEEQKSKDWMNKNLNPQEQSGFIRDAVKNKISIYKSKPSKKKG